jgi:EH domain-containing protein 1
MGGFGSSMLTLSDAAILDRLKHIYATKLRPLERKSMYHELREPALSDAWFDAKPMVLLLGQYSVGKTSFIRYLLGRNFPNQHVGPEPTTDRFVAVMYGDREKVTPGNALTSQPDTPFHSLRHYGTKYLDKLECASVPAPILRRISLVDSPGVQAGEKQKGGRGYDYLEVMKWWAQHSDRVILLFDPNKLDISDEFRDVIEELKAHQSKVRVILNKADEVEPQKLMRVYGALMWSLGSIVASPEVPRVYIGSFWDAPFQNGGMRGLMEAEEADLVQELAALPEDNVMNKINEIARRARLVQVHVHLMSFMREQVLSKWMGRKQAQEWVCSPEGMRHCYEQTQRQHSLSRGDFPNWQRLADHLRSTDFSQLYKPSVERSKKLRMLHELMETDIPTLITQLHAVQKRQASKDGGPSVFQPVRQKRPPAPTMIALEAAAREEQRQSQRLALASSTARLRAATANLAPRGLVGPDGGQLQEAPPPAVQPQLEQQMPNPQAQQGMPGMHQQGMPGMHPGMQQQPPPGMHPGMHQQPMPGMHQQPPPGMYQQPPPGMHQQPPHGMHQQPPPGMHQQQPMPGMQQQQPMPGMQSQPHMQPQMQSQPMPGMGGGMAEPHPAAGEGAPPAAAAASDAPPPAFDGGGWPDPAAGGWPEPAADGSAEASASPPPSANGDTPDDAADGGWPESAGGGFEEASASPPPSANGDTPPGGGAADEADAAAAQPPPADPLGGLD